MRFGYENLFDSVTATLKVNDYRSGDDGIDGDGYLMDVRISSHRFSSLFSYSLGFMSESDFLNVPEDQSPGGPDGLAMNHTQPTPSPLSISKKRPIEPDGCIFVGSFDRLSAEDLHNLEEIYRKRQGKRPSKREVKLYSSVYGIPQCKIKRWFDAKLGLQDGKEEQPVKQHIVVSQARPDPILSSYVPIYPKADSDPEISSMLGELEENASQLEELNNSIGGFISGMLK